ncbi:MAG TPA: PIG-L family deacetylase [Candidatus Paceibacterota bacterium]|nr:PIG-L family deacetylase [Candidatus Paceibacterota bacterium]
MLAPAQTSSSAEILRQLKDFRELGGVLYIAAHPDDEDTQLITYLARGRHYRTAYLSLTRGDGGQNVLGPEFDSELGVIRTQELLAARRLDGGQQFFTRAIDFGYSKDYRETLRIWNKQEVLSDVVRVIRTFQPDVVIAGFAPQQTPGNHGHHVASAFLAVEAFKLAGDTNAFPDQLTYLKPWQPKRLLQNQRFGGRGGGGNPPLGPHLEISGDDPVLGISFSEIAARSRAMHKSQGFDNFRGFGGAAGSRTANFLVLDGESTTNDIMDGIDTTWSRVPGGAAIGKQADEIIAKFDTNNRSASVEELLKAKREIAALAIDRLLTEKTKQLDKILQSCLGLSVATTVAQAEVVPGEVVKMHSVVKLDSNIPVRWRETLHPGWIENWDSKNTISLAPHETANRNHEIKLSLASSLTPLTQPYWLRKEPTAGMFRVDDPKLIGTPENLPALPVAHLFEVGGQTITVLDEPVQAGTESGKFEARRTLKVIAPVSLRCADEVTLFAPGASRDVSIEVTAARPDTKGELSLDAPADWKISPGKQSFHFASAGEKKIFSFKVAVPSQIASAKLTARAKVGDEVYENQRIEISYPHIPAQLLQPPARLKAVALDLTIRGKRIGYIPGAGDSVADALKQMGYEVTMLGGDDLTTNRLKNFDAVVVGIRAFNVRTDLASHLPDLFAFVENGGNLIEQYNRPGNDLKTNKLAPYSLRLSGERVTDETAEMKFLAPDHPALNTPNKITAKDFEGWVQERGIYFPNQWDEHWTPILACADTGEELKSGSLLIAQYGKGYFVYTGLDFFRQLPAGVPGAYRLFANLVSLGK